MDLRQTFGTIDIYLFDQLLKGTLTPEMKLLDAGCGDGRNLVYFLRGGFDLYAVDQSERAITEVRRLATEIAPALAADHFLVEPVESLSFEDSTFDYVISSAVLHFARDETHWQSMLREMWRVLKGGGTLFARLASEIGIEDRIQRIEGRRFHLPDGSDRFLVDIEMLESAKSDLGAELLEPIKSVLVHERRSMTTWVLRKSPLAARN